MSGSLKLVTLSWRPVAIRLCRTSVQISSARGGRPPRAPLTGGPMIPTNPERDDLNPARGIIMAFILGLLILLAAFMSVLLLTCSPGHSIKEQPADDLISRIEQMQMDLEAESALRAEAGRRFAEYMRLGGVLKKHNPALTIAEQHEIGKAVATWSARYGLDARLMLAVIIVESGGDYEAVSPRGAVGLMQVMHWWPERLGVKGDLRVIETNVRVGAFILADNIRRWGTDEGVARYFWGTAARPDGSYLARVRAAREAIEG